VIKSTDAEGRVTEFTYDAMNRLISVLDPDLKVTSYDYDSKGNLTEVTDAKNQTTTFAYDEMDRLISATNPLGLTEPFTYDANGNLISTTNRNGQTLTFEYDALNRLIKKTLPPSASQAGNQVTDFTYDDVGNLAAIANPAVTVFNQYDLANRLVVSLSTTEVAATGGVTIIDQDTLIDENNIQFEGQTLQVDGVTLTINGSHIFANLVLTNGAVLSHSPTTATTLGKLDITVTGVIQIDATSKIDVTGRGFLGDDQPGNPFFDEGMTVGFQSGSTGRSGGGYGGLGGASDGVSNPVYGDFTDPNDPGSGGGSDAFTLAGNGGGLVRIVAQTLQLDGLIVANGGDAAAGSLAAGGSGGGVRIDAGTLSGAGQITANGGDGVSTSGFGVGGGGGGRVAVYYQDATGFDLAIVSVSGGLGDSAPNGQDGTVFLQQQTFMGLLLPNIEAPPKPP